MERKNRHQRSTNSGLRRLHLGLHVSDQRRGIFNQAGRPEAVYRPGSPASGGESGHGAGPHCPWHPLFCIPSLHKSGSSYKRSSDTQEGLYTTGGYGHLTIVKNVPHPSATKVFVNWLLGKEGQEIFSKAMGAPTRRLDVDTKWSKDFGVLAAKYGLTLEQFYRMENQSEERIYKVRDPAAALARKLLD